MPLPITAVFDDLPDPRRQTANELHRRTDVLTVATCAVLGGADTWDAIAAYSQAKPTERRKAGWDDEFLLQVLQGITADVVR